MAEGWMEIMHPEDRELARRESQLIDTSVAEMLTRAAKAVQLLGTEAVLTGIRPEVAQTLVALGTELRGITTRGSLQSGVAYAMTRH
jgi:rsbT co-antagonist protein RsbR